MPIANTVDKFLCMHDAWTDGTGSNTIIVYRAVPEFGSGSGRNTAFFTNPADIRLRPKLGRISNFAGFGKLSLNNTNLNDLCMNCSINGMCYFVPDR